VTKPKAISKAEDDLDEDEAQALKEVASKGYCHFRRQQTAEEKELIGDIAPKKIGDEISMAAAPAASVDSTDSTGNKTGRPEAKGGSAWNSGGTWEEADFSVWAKDTMTGYLKSAHGGGEVGASVTKVVKVDGDASVAVVRGIKRYLFDLSAELEYEMLIGETKYKGTLTLTDISHSDDMEISVRPKKDPAAAHKPLAEAALTALKLDITGRCVSSFKEEFHSKF